MPVLGLQLQTLEGNPGILPVREGQAYMQTDHWTIVKILNLERIYNDLNFIIHNYEQFNNMIKQNESYPRDFVTMNMHLDYLRDITVQKYRQLVPQQRFKRGIINPLGSIIKIVTGNLDHEDAIRYDELISKLSHNEIIISKKLTLVSQIIDSFINTTDTINKNSILLEARMKILESMLQELASQKKRWDYSTYIVSFYNLFISNFRTIFVKLGEIETALAFSKISILHQSIVNSTELLYHLRLISNTENLVYPATENNLVKLEETVNIKSYIKHNQITFIIEIPLTDNNTYNYYKLYSLPMFHESENKTLSIFPQYPYLLAKGMKYLPIEKPCRPLAAGDHYLCADDNRAPYPELTCIEQLMRFDANLTRCVQRQIHIEDVRVQPIAAASWILYTRLKTVVTAYCAAEVTKHPVFGTYIATLDKPCDFEIHGIRVRHHRAYTESDLAEPIPVIELPRLSTSESTNVPLSGARVLNMKKINLDEVKYMSYALKHSEMLNSVLREPDSNLSVVLYFTLSLVFICLFIIFTYMFRNKLLLVCSQNYRNVIKNERTDNFPLGEGGVMHPPEPSILD